MLIKRITPEEKIIKGLETVGYTGPLLNKADLIAAIDGGPKSIEYTKTINFLTNEIRTLSNIDEEVNAITTPEDSISFIMELTSLLKELNCPYGHLTEGHVSDRLQNTSDRLTVLDYLVTELMGARILQDNKPERKLELKLQETPEAADLRVILQTLKFPKPPANLTVSALFQKLNPTIGIVLQKAGVNLVGEGLFKGELSKQQWEILEGVQNDLNNEYKIRREMLLTRLDVTVQSFQWSDKTKGKEDTFEKLYASKRKLLKVEPDVEITDLLSARTDLAIIEKTSSSNVRKNTRTSLNKVIIGQVPDRGGRTTEIAPPPPEMPSWQQRVPGPSGAQGGGGRGGRGGNRGGGYQRDQQNKGGNYQNKAFDSAGGYTVETQYSSNNSGYRSGAGYDNRGSGYDNRAGSSYSDNRGANNYYDNRGGNGYNDNRGYSNRDNQGGGGYRAGYDNRSGYDNSYGGGNRRDSGGSYNEQTSKRPKTYDSYQSNKTTYADQYVQDSQHNQQYHRGGGRGRSNYGRGRGNYRN